MADDLLKVAFESAYTAIFEIGSIMAVLMFLFGALDYHRGEWLRQKILRHRLDRPSLMTGLALIPVDGTLLFQYSAYRRGSLRFGSLLGGIIGIGEEATYLIVAFQPLAWVYIVIIKLILALPLGTLFNRSRRLSAWAKRLREKDRVLPQEEDLLLADENFHELPDKFRHKMHHFRYHTLGAAFWIFFAAAFLIQMGLFILERAATYSHETLMLLEVPFFHWLAMLALILVFLYLVVIRLTTKEFGKIFESEFSDALDALGDLAETCAQVILVIFAMTLLVQGILTGIGQDRIESVFQGLGYLSVVLAALIGLIPGTGASLAFTALYFALRDTPGALPFAALAACSIALIGDSQIVGRKQLRASQKAAHLIAFALALIAGSLLYAFESWFF